MDTEKFCKSCEICAQPKGEYQKPLGKLHLLQIATRPWESIGMDFVGPFLEENRYNYLWVVICRMTSMVHLVPVNTKTTASQLSAILYNYMDCHLQLYVTKIPNSCQNGGINYIE